MLNSRAIGVVLVSVLLYSGCFLSKRVLKTMDSWALPQAKLIRSWGPPTRTASDAPRVGAPPVVCVLGGVWEKWARSMSGAGVSCGRARAEM